MPVGKSPAGPRCDSSPYHSIPLVSIVGLVRRYAAARGPIRAQPVISRRAAAAVATSEVAA